MLKVGITGGIGSGKTTVCGIFEAMNVPIYYADDRAKYLMNHDPQLIEKIKARFGAETYTKGRLNRAHLAEIVFADKTQLQALNALVHPAVHADGDAWFAGHRDKPYAIKEAALHFESGGYKFLDKMITVFAPETLRLQRVMQRDAASTEAVQARMRQQMPDAEKVRLADFVIYNDGTQSLIQQVFKIHTQLRAISK